MLKNYKCDVYLDFLHFESMNLAEYLRNSAHDQLTIPDQIGPVIPDETGPGIPEQTGPF
jgi:hypothetical protein